MQPIAEFTGEIIRVQSMASGAPRFVFEGIEADLDMLSILAKSREIPLHVVIYDHDEFMEEVQKANGKAT